jgi:hypothetical protein
MTGIRLWGSRLFGGIYIAVRCLLAYGKGLASYDGWIMNGKTGVKLHGLGVKIECDNSDTLYIREIKNICFQH